MSERYTVKNKVWMWPGASANWHFIYLDGDIKEVIRKQAKYQRKAMVKVEAQIGKSIWKTSLFWHRKDNCYLLPIKKAIRQAEGIFDGDEISVDIRLI